MALRSLLSGRAIKAVLTIAGLVTVVLIAGSSNVWAALRSMDARWLLAMYAATLCARAVEAGQMRLLLSRAGAPVRWLRVFLANLLSAFYSLIAPGDLIASGAKWSNLAAATGQRGVVFHAMVYNRLVLLLPSFLVGGIALAIESPFGRPWLSYVLVVGAVISLAMALALWHPRSDALLRLALRPMMSLFPRRIAQRVSDGLSSLRSLRAFGWRDHVAVICVGLIASALGVAVTALGFIAVGIRVEVTTIIWVHAAVVAVRQLPITFSGLGVREGLLVVLLAPYGVGAETAVALGLLRFSNSLLLGAFGGCYQLSLAVGWARWSMHDQQGSQLESPSEDSHDGEARGQEGEK